MNPKGLSALSVEAGNGKLSSSPLLRKSMEAVNISLMQNDDEAELLEQRKLAEKELLDSVEDPLQIEEYSNPKVSKKKTRKRFRSTVATNLDTIDGVDDGDAGLQMEADSDAKVSKKKTRGLFHKGFDETLAMTSCAAPRRPPDALVDPQNHLSTILQESSYFKPESLSLRAGPGHSKTKLPKSSATHYGVKSRPMKNEVVDLFSPIDHAKFAPSNNIQLLPETIRSWSPTKTTQPHGTHYNPVDLSKLYFRPNMVIMGREEKTAVLGEDGSNYNYENEIDRGNYGPNIIPESADEDDDHCMDQETLLTQDNQALTGDNLVEPPNNVTRVFVPYATTAKNIDVKKLN